jgi:hypothetical protein
MPEKHMVCANSMWWRNAYNSRTMKAGRGEMRKQQTSEQAAREKAELL